MRSSSQCKETKQPRAGIANPPRSAGKPAVRGWDGGGRVMPPPVPGFLGCDSQVRAPRRTSLLFAGARGSLGKGSGCASLSWFTGKRDGAQGLYTPVPSRCVHLLPCPDSDLPAPEKGCGVGRWWEGAGGALQPRGPLSPSCSLSRRKVSPRGPTRRWFSFSKVPSSC